MSKGSREAVAKLYTAFFNRAPESSGLKYWAEDSGLEMAGIARSFFDQAETQEKYPADLSNESFVETIYSNLFNHAPDAEGLAYWVGELNRYEESGGSEGIPRSEMILAVMNGARDVPQKGIYDATILNHKADVALHFADEGLEYGNFYLDDVTENAESRDAAMHRIDKLAESGAAPVVLILDDGIAGDGVVDLTEAMGDIAVTGHAYEVNPVKNPIKEAALILSLNGKSFDGSVEKGHFSVTIPGADFAADSDSTLDGFFKVTYTDETSVQAQASQEYEVDRKLEDVTKLYTAFFNRAPDSDGLKYWVEDSGLDLGAISQSFFAQEETLERYPASLSNEEFVKAIYTNLFNHEPDLGGLEYWVKELDRYEESGGKEGIPREKMILAVMNGARDIPEENVHDASILEHKEEAGSYFAMSGMKFTDFYLHDITEDISTRNDAIDLIDKMKLGEEDSFAKIILDPDITEDDTIDLSESQGTVTITGHAYMADKVDGHPVESKTVILTVNGQQYSGEPKWGEFSIEVPGSELAADPDHTIEAEYEVTYEGGHKATAHDSEGYSVEIERPDAPTVETPIEGDDIINAQEEHSVVLSGEAAVGTTVYVTITDESGNQVSAAAHQSAISSDPFATIYPWTTDAFDVGTLKDGSLSVSVIAKDDHTGNSSEAVEKTVLLDTTAPYLNNIGLTDETNSGGEGHTLTNVNPPAIEGYAEPGSTVTVTYQDVGSVTRTESGSADENGHFTIALGHPLMEGTNELTLQSEDPAGNRGDQVAYDVGIDTKIGIGSIDLAASSDWGESGDDITADTTPTFRIALMDETDVGNVVQLGTVEGAGATFHTFGYVSQDDKARGYMELTLPSGVVKEEGEKTFVAQVKDGANNIAWSNELSVTFDTTPPPLSGIGLSEETDSGTKGDGLTNVNTPTIVGTTEAGAKVSILYSDGEETTRTAEGRADENGHFAIGLTEALGDGHNVLEVTATDVAGNSTMHPYGLEIDTQANVGILDLTDASDTGVSNVDDYTNDPTPTFMFEVGYGSKAGDQIQLSMQETGGTITETLSRSLTQAEVDQGYAYLTMSEIETGGVKEFRGIQWDAAGNRASTEPLSVTFDFEAPGAPSVALSHDSGESDSDGITNDAALEVVPSEEGDSLEYSLNGVDWSGEAPAFDADGDYSLRVRELDKAGNPSEAAVLNFTLDTTAPTIEEQPHGELGTEKIYVGIDEEGYGGLYPDEEEFSGLPPDDSLIGSKGALSTLNGTVYEGYVTATEQAELTKAHIVVEDLAGNRTESETENIILGSADMDTVAGDEHTDLIYGFGGNDELVGQSGDDYLNGGEGDDILEGGEGDDLMTGGSGKDYLRGGEGTDRMSGGDGADEFFFADSGDTGLSRDSIDWIEDFTSGEDTIDFDSLGGGKTRPIRAINYTEESNDSFSESIANANHWLSGGTTGVYYVSYVSDDDAVYLFLDSDGDGNVDEAIGLAGIDLSGIDASDIVA